MGGTRFVILLLDWDKPDKSVTLKLLGCISAGTHKDAFLFYQHYTLALVPGMHPMKYPSSFMGELRTSDFSSARVLAKSPQIA